METLENLGLSLSNLHGLGHDGASIMSGEKQVFKQEIVNGTPRHFILIVLAIHFILPS